MIFKHLRDEIDAIIERDPAARTRLEVVLCYPGFHALLYHRVANWAWRGNWRLLGRFVSHIGRVLTGIEIHPAAKIGKRLFIDHGMGVVVGETSEIGNDVTIYQGVVLGGTSLDKGKRHPSLGNGVIVGAGAKILGPLFVGDAARIGSNAVVLKDVPAGATMVGVPARQVVRAPVRAARTDFCAYGQDPDLPDPVARALDGLCSEIAALRTRLDELESQAKTEKPPLSVVGGGR
jgi:serine O-acetyltransferase